MRWLLLVAFNFAFQAQALQINLIPAARTYPLSGSVEANARHEYLLWDQREEQFWKYGFLQARGGIAAHGMAEAGVSFFPISFVELGVSSSLTNRFYESRVFNCKDEICFGQVRRDRLTLRLIAGYSDVVGILSLNSQSVHIEDDSKPLADESENILAHAGADTLKSESLLLGYKMGSRFAGVYARQARFERSEQKNESQHAVYRFPFHELFCGVGVGRYASSVSPPGLSVYATVLWTWGSSLALF